MIIFLCCLHNYLINEKNDNEIKESLARDSYLITTRSGVNVATANDDGGLLSSDDRLDNDPHGGDIW